MVRLGYARCSACHLAPQGAGLLTDYGKGIDEAQSLRAADDNAAENEPRVHRYDMRALAIGHLTTPAPSGVRPLPPSWFRTYVRDSIGAGPHNRFASTILIEAPPGDAERLWTSRPTVDAALAWEYAPSQRVTFAVARDRLPRGVELGETKTILQDGADPDRYPSQVRAFLTTNRFAATGYAFGPGSPGALDRESHGAGGLGEAHFYDHHLVMGGSFRQALTDGTTRRSVGSYIRFGVGNWGVLAEHELTARTMTTGIEPSPRRYAGYTQLFVAPREWLVTSLVAEQAVEPGAERARVFRWRPEVQARLSSSITITASARTDVIPSTGGVARIYLLQASLKTVQ